MADPSWSGARRRRRRRAARRSGRRRTSITCARSLPEAGRRSRRSRIAHRLRQRRDDARWRRRCSTASASTSIVDRRSSRTAATSTCDCGSTHPERLARDGRRRAAAGMGVAFDGDGDRAIFVDHRGRVVDGDAVLLMCAPPAAARGPAEGRRGRRDRDEQHRPRDRAARARHRAGPQRRSATST